MYPLAEQTQTDFIGITILLPFQLQYFFLNGHAFRASEQLVSKNTFKRNKVSDYLFWQPFSFYTANALNHSVQRLPMPPVEVNNIR